MDKYSVSIIIYYSYMNLEGLACKKWQNEDLTPSYSLLKSRPLLG